MATCHASGGTDVQPLGPFRDDDRALSQAIDVEVVDVVLPFEPVEVEVPHPHAAPRTPA